MGSFTREDILKLIKENKGRRKIGSDCTFYPLNDEWGIKLYWWEDTRDIQYSLQKEAATLNLGPPVGQIYYFSELRKKYGFTTRRVQTRKNYLLHGGPRFNQLKNELLKNNFNTDDLHDRNFGEIDGRLVCIDFE